MTDWKHYKENGPWEFTAQDDKRFYNEGNLISSAKNPVWENNFTGTSITPDHDPCGYWYRDAVPIQFTPGISIYGLYSTGASIWSAYFNGTNELTYTGSYDSPSGDINGLVLHDGNLLTMGGTGSTASLRLINATPVNNVLSLIQEIYPFNNYDVTNPTHGTLAKNPISGNIYYAETSANNIGGTFLKITPSLSKEFRSFLGDLVIGTDSNYYLFYVDSPINYQLPVYQPITGSLWNTYYYKIPDNETARTPVIFGTQALKVSDGVQPRLLIHPNTGVIYASISAVHTRRFCSYDPTNLDYITNIKSEYGTLESVSYGSYIYSMENALNCVLIKYDEDLNLVGSLSLGTQSRSIITTADCIIILTTDIVTNVSTIYKIDPITLSILASHNLGSTIIWQRLAVINDRFIALGGNQNAGVFDLLNMLLVTAITIPGVTNFSTKELVVKVDE